MLQFFVNILKIKRQNSPNIVSGETHQNHQGGEVTSKIQTSGTYDGEFYALNIAFTDNHVVTLDGLSKEDMLELLSCVDCMVGEE